MAARSSILGLAALLAPISLWAQTTQDLAKILERLDRLNVQFQRRFGERIAERIGLNTGEVVGSRETAAEAAVSRCMSKPITAA